MYAQPFLLSCASASALRPLRMPSCTCPACTCAKASSPQHKASVARFVKGWVGEAPMIKKGSESSCEALGAALSCAYSARDASRQCMASSKSPTRRWLHPSKERLLASSSLYWMPRARESACSPYGKEHLGLSHAQAS